MSHRQPRLKDQAKLLREAFSARGLPLPHGEALELASRLNGYPSWNVACRAQPSNDVEAPTQLKFQVWTAVYRHRHGEDLFYFTHLPTDAEIEETIDNACGYEPDQDESYELRGVETFEIDLPLELARQASRKMPAPLIGIYEVCMTDLVEYSSPCSVPEWSWIANHASFQHKGNGIEGGVWEFMVHAEKLRNCLDDVPALLQTEVRKGLELGAAWVMFYQG